MVKVICQKGHIAAGHGRFQSTSKLTHASLSLSKTTTQTAS